MRAVWLALVVTAWTGCMMAAVFTAPTANRAVLNGLTFLAVGLVMALLM